MSANLLNKLTEIAVKNAKPKENLYKLADGGGLFLLALPDGRKYWRLQYRELGKQKTLALGVYPHVTLTQARAKREEARALLADGVDPARDRKAQKRARLEANANTFEVVAREWHAKQSLKWSESTKKKNLWLLEAVLLPHIGGLAINQINARDVLATLRKAEAREVFETAHRAKSVTSQVFRYAVATGRADSDPTGALKGALATVNKTHHAAIIDPKEVGRLMVAIDSFSGSLVVKGALLFSALVFQRQGEVRHAEWAEIDFEKREWSIPAQKMKMKNPHIVPLSRQAIEILEKLKRISGNGKYIFPSQRGQSRPLSENGVRTALRTLGFSNDEMTPHGFRAMARTILDEVLGERVDIIEQQLAHAVKDANGRAYNRTAHLPARHHMMQRWADYLDDLRKINSDNVHLFVRPLIVGE